MRESLHCPANENWPGKQRLEVGVSRDNMSLGALLELLHIAVSAGQIIPGFALLPSSKHATV